MNKPITCRDVHGTVTAAPERMAALLAERAKASKIPSVKAARAKARAKADKRVYPRFIEGQSTAEYVAAYWRLNGHVVGLYSPLTNARTGLRLSTQNDVMSLIDDFYNPLSRTPQHTPIEETVAEEELV